MEKISYKEVPMEKYNNDTIKSLCAEVGITKPDGTVDKSFGLINNLKKFLGGK